MLTAPEELIIKMLPFSPPLDTTGLGTFDHTKGCSSYLKHYQRKGEPLCLAVYCATSYHELLKAS